MANDKLNQDGNPFDGVLTSGTSFIKSVLSFAPIAVGAGLGIRNIVANDPIRLNQFARSNIDRVGRSVGAGLRRSIKSSQQARLRAAEKIAQDLLDDDALKNLLQKTRERNAVIQALLTYLDEGADLTREQLIGFKDELMKVAASSEVDEEGEQIIRSAVRTIMESNNPQDRLRFEGYLQEFTSIGNQLVAPSRELKSGRAYNPIEASQLTKGARRRYDKLIDNLGEAAKQNIELVSVDQGGGRFGTYARIWSGRPGQSRWLTSLPLEITSRGDKPVHPTLRMGREFETTYAANRYYIDAQKALALVKKKGAGNVGIEDLRRGGAMIELEDYMLQEFFGRRRVSGTYISLPGQNEFNALMRQPLHTTHRITTLQSNQSYASLPSEVKGFIHHLESQQRFSQNAVAILNMHRIKGEERELLTGLVGGEGIEPGISAARMAGQVQASLGVTEGSLISKLAVPGAINRFMFPITGRLEQIAGRPAQFIRAGRPKRTMGVGGVFEAGPSARNIEWANALTGATNKAVLLDVSETGRVAMGFGGGGYALTAGRETIRTPFTKPIMEPVSSRNLSSKLLEKILQAPPGTMVEITRGELASSRGYLGQGAAGPQYLRLDLHTKAIYIASSPEVTETAGKRMIRLSGYLERELPAYKMFSTLFKGMVKATSPELLRREIEQYKGVSAVMGRLGMSLEDTILAAGDMLKKGPGFLNIQMSTGFAMATGRRDYVTYLNRLARESRFNLGQGELARLTGAVIQGLAEAGADPEAAGMVLAGVYQGGTTYRDPVSGKTKDPRFLSGAAKKLAISRTTLEQAVKSAFGEKADIVLEMMRQGVALGGTSGVAGAGVGDWGEAMGSVEPRFLMNLQHRLRRMGLAESEVSDILVGIYRNRVGMAQHLEIYGGLARTMESLTAGRGVLDELAGKFTRVGLEEVQEGIVRHGDLTSFIRHLTEKTGGGIVLDLRSGRAKGGAGAAIAYAAERVFGQGEIFLPGENVLQQMRSAFIVGPEGTKQEVLPEYMQKVNQLGKDLATIGASSVRAREEAVDAFNTFKQDIAAIFARVHSGLARGKIKGAAFGVAHPYDISTGVGMEKRHLGLVRGLFSKTKGQAVFIDDPAFLGAMKRFMKSSGAKRKDVAEMLRVFYTGLEARPGTSVGAIVEKARGIATIISRHPQLSLGNVQVAQFFRHVEAVGKLGKEDIAFRAFAETDAGKRALQELSKAAGGRKIRSFRDIAEIEQQHGRAVSRFFNRMAANLEKFYAFEGGGSIYQPRAMFDVHYGDTTLRVDFGTAAAGLGDWDGDQWMFMILNKDARTKLMSTLTSEAKRNQYMTAENLYKIKSEIFIEEAKKGLKALGKEIEWGDIESIRQDLLKEYESKNAVGLLDANLNKLRAAVLGMAAEENMGAIEEVLALLKATEEHALIKGKKLETFVDIAGRLTGAIEELWGTGDITRLRQVMETEIFAGSELLTERGITARLSEGAPGWIAKSVSGTTLRLENSLKTIQQAANSARARVGGRREPLATKSGRDIARMLSEGEVLLTQTAMKDLLYSGNILESGIAAGYFQDHAKQALAAAEGVATKIKGAAMKLDARLMGPLAIGIGASMAISSIFGYEGYAPKPLVMPGEVVSPRVGEAIAMGNLFEQRNVGSTPEDFLPRSNQYDMINRPVDISATYMQRPNPYQVRGEVLSETGLSSMSTYMSLLAGRGGGSITIHDDRRPITANYMDRMLGEY